MVYPNGRRDKTKTFLLIVIFQWLVIMADAIKPVCCCLFGVIQMANAIKPMFFVIRMANEIKPMFVLFILMANAIKPCFCLSGSQTESNLVV